jgi:septal ring factor EnvC (AmiA/AmiB activator)
MSYLAKDDGRRLTAYREASDALVETRARLASRRAEARSLEAEARARRAGAESAYARKQELLAELTQETGRRQRWLAELIAARTRLDATMTDRASAVAPTAPALRVPLESRRRQLPWPVPGAVAQRFGRQRDGRFGTTTVNNGITIAAAAGAPVRALHPGTVAFAGPFTGFGQLVIVDHGRQAYSLYGYLSGVRVQRGTAIDAGVVVGDVGDAPDGSSSLYLEVRVDGRPVDPLQWLKQAQ